MFFLFSNLLSLGDENNLTIFQLAENKPPISKDLQKKKHIPKSPTPTCLTCQIDHPDGSESDDHLVTGRNPASFSVEKRRQ